MTISKKRVKGIIMEWRGVSRNLENPPAPLDLGAEGRRFYYPLQRRREKW